MSVLLAPVVEVLLTVVAISVGLCALLVVAGDTRV